MMKKNSILIVDDRPENLLSLRAVLEDDDLEIITARSGNEALGLTLDHDFALILLDVQMPQMDGFETAALLRARRKTHAIPIIFVTAINKEARHVFHGYEKGAVDYLFKPVDPLVLQSKVRVFVDLHEQKKQVERYAEKLEQTVAQLRTSEADLKASEQKYRLLVETADDAIFILQNDRICFHNRKTELFFGHTPEQLKEILFWELIDPEGRPALHLKHQQLIENPPDDASASVSIRFISQHEQRWGEITSITVDWEGENGLLCFVRDITEQRRLEAHLQQAHKMEAIGTLAGGIAHDFNNILGVIIGYSEMASQEVEDVELVSHNLHQVLKASHRAKELVQQILTFSHKNDQIRKPVIINPIVKEALKMLRASLPKTIEIKEHISSKMMLAESNPTQIHQVLMNLCTNAAHAMDKKGGEMTVKLEPLDAETSLSFGVQTLPPGAYIRLQVSDTGHGMDADILEKIYDPYFTTKDVGKGTGMGLAVVHGIVYSYQGIIDVRSEPGQGTRFDVILPRLTEKQDPAEEQFSPGLFSVENKHALFVDDEISLSTIAKQMLENIGFQVDALSDPLSALKVFKEHPGLYDLVITDMTMPQMTGDVLTGELIKIRPDIPVIICTGYSEYITDVKARKVGAKCLMMKPLTMKTLMQAVQLAMRDNA